MSFFAKEFDELTSKEIYEILKSRGEIFLMEQGILYLDEDNLDFKSLHVFSMEDGRVTSYLRAFYDDKGVLKIGRVLTLKHGDGLGKKLMEFALKEIPKRMPSDRICMDAQKHAIGFYEQFGFEVTSDEYMEEGIVHVDMCLNLTRRVSEKYYAYIVRCADGTLYTGYTDDLQKRIATHNEGKGAKYTKARLPVELAYYEIFDSKEDAMSREWHIKHDLTKQQKEKLIDGGKK
jgi:ElaA protein